MLSFKHEIFFEVARQLSFTRASEVLSISQPAASKQIKQLEEHYKTSLFVRKGMNVSLTEAGKVLYRHLQSAKTLARQLDIDLGNAGKKQQLRGDLKLGGSTTVALYIIPPVLSGFRKKFTDVKISLLNRNSENVLKALLDNEIDLGIIEGRKKMAKVSSTSFLVDEVVAVCSSASSLAKKAKCSLSELKRIPIALRERGSGTLAALTESLHSKGINISDLSICMRLGGTEALKNFVLADDCLGFLPMRSVAKELANGDLTRISIEGLTITRHFYFVQRHGDESSQINNSFIRFAKGYYNIKL
jgi:DNA-binding transcriptional LysR family regulator